MREFKDQLGRTVSVVKNPQRIISLVPSQTELLYDLGLGDKVVGITKFCVHPDSWFQEKTRVGGTKNVNHKKIAELAPDLIIANKEENAKEDIEALMELYPVWVSDINTYDEALAMIKAVGQITNCETASLKLVSKIQANFNKLSFSEVKTCVYLIWKDPVMVVGSANFVNEMLGKAGFVNLVNAPRYPEASVDEISKLNPQTILLSSEPYPFKEKHIIEFEQYFPDAKVMIVDGEMFSWYGSRLAKSALYFKYLCKD